MGSVTPLPSAPLTAVSGRSASGQPLPYQRAPAADLSPWIARMFYSAADQPAGHTVDCGLFNDTPFVRVVMAGDWAAEASNGFIRRSRGLLLFGPHSRMLPISVGGPFVTFGFALRPGALAALDHPWGRVATDAVVEIAPTGPFRDWADPGPVESRDAEGWLAWLEDGLRQFVAARRPSPPDPLALALDHAAFADPGEPIAAFAHRMGVSERRVVRMARTHFGVTPKWVMRRARVLDMASQLLGFVDRDEAEDYALRFYDQSHLIRDFRALIGKTPRQLARATRPILALGLESRQARRLEVLGKLEAGKNGPWR